MRKREMEDRVRGRSSAKSAATIRTALALTLALGLGVIGFLAAGALAGEATNATVSLRTTKLGPILVNSKGHTLYLFAKDRTSRSTCTGPCATYWPPLVSRGKLTAGPGVKRSLIGTTRRRNGAMQVNYNKHPLYTYLLDKRPGQTTGQRISAFGARWYAVSAAGKAVLKPVPSPGTTTDTTSTTTYPTDPYP
jgi:predicted lipoprotein with Yx(FWY)xxD motif